MNAAEHADHADGVAHLAHRSADRRGNGAQADLVFAVFDRVAVLAAGIQLLKQRRDIGDGIRREGRPREAAEQALGLLRRAAGKEGPALRRAVDGKPRADIGDDAQLVPRLDLIERNNARALADREHHGRVCLLRQQLHGFGDGHDHVAAHHGGSTFLLFFIILYPLFFVKNIR